MSLDLAKISWSQSVFERRGSQSTCTKKEKARKVKYLRAWNVLWCVCWTIYIESMYARRAQPGPEASPVRQQAQARAQNMHYF